MPNFVTDDFGMGQQPTLYFRDLQDHNPSMEIDDIWLDEGWYLCKGHAVKRGEMARTEGKLWVPISQDTRTHNLARVIRTADEGCSKAKAGKYVFMPPYGGNYHDDKKPIPLKRKLEDEEELWLIHEDMIFAVIPEAAIIEDESTTTTA
jgi:hypothetical protein